MIIIIASDHNGIKEKSKVKKFLKSKGYSVIDIGPHNSEKVDYVDYASQLSEIISSKEADKGILICGTGVGMNIVSNRFKGVRSVLAHNLTTALKSREHNNSNVLCLGSWINNLEEMKKICISWLEEQWAEGRHVKRVERIDENKGLVFTNGVFDLLHQGHIELLKFAKTQGHKLIVAIDSDERVRELKGPDRPINNQKDRKKILESNIYVDEVLIFNSQDELENFYRTLRPKITVRGAELSQEQIRKNDNIPENVQIVVFPIFEQYSTTRTVNRIQGINS